MLQPLPHLHHNGCRAHWRSALIGCALLGLSACGGGGGGSDSGSAAAAPVVATPAAVSSVLRIELGALPNYAAPSLPAYYTDRNTSARDNTPAANAANDRVITLGRVLFYDKQLSTNNTIACASCHQQALGFTDSARLSQGINPGQKTSAHAMRLGNARYFRPGSAFWDRRAASLEAQASQPVTDPQEMGFDTAHGGMGAAVSKLQALPYYPELFQFAFGDTTVTEDRIQRALAQFERSIVSTNSRWDSGYASTYNPNDANRNLDADVPGLSVQENRGRALFMGGVLPGVNCAACHTPPSFALNANSRSNGLDGGETRIFKSPSLKNIALSGTFMHDGRFSSLAQVVEHYNSGIQDGPALDNRLQRNGVPQRLNLSAADKAALVAFMQTLTDTELLQAERFGNPFR